MDGIPNLGFSIPHHPISRYRPPQTNIPLLGLERMDFDFSPGDYDVVKTPPGVYEICWCGNRHEDRGAWWEDWPLCEETTEFSASLGTLSVRGPIIDNQVTCIRGQPCMVYRFEGTDFFDGLQQTPPSTGVDRLLIRMGSCDTTFDLRLSDGQVCSRGDLDEGIFDFQAALYGFPARPAPQDTCIVPLMSGGDLNGYSGGAYQIRDAGSLESFQFGGGTTKAFPW